MDLNLRGRIALVTGASKGIGLAIARALAAEGCQLYLVARTAADLDRAAADITRDFGVEAVACTADLGRGADILAVAKACQDIDILVNCAGGIPMGTLTEIDEQRWRQAWDLKVFGTINLTREVYGPMCRRGRGVIINIVGIAGLRPDANYIAGGMANAALIYFSRALGGDSIRHGVRVVALNPGPVVTDKLIGDARRRAAERLGDPERWQEIFAGLPMKRAADVAEIAGLAAFLASDHAAYISGTAIDVDGGMLADAALGVKRG